MWKRIVAIVSKKDNINLPDLPIDVIIMIAEQCCEIDSFNGIKMWQISKKLHKSSNLKKYYFIAKRLLLQKFMRENYSIETFGSQTKVLSVTIINTDEYEYNYYNFTATEPGISWMDSTDDNNVHILDVGTKLNIRNIYNFDDPFVTIKYREISKDIRVSKIIWKDRFLFPQIQIFRGYC